MHPHTVLLDLDGTLVDSGSGILGSLRAALDELGIDYPESALGPQLVGPPMYETLPPLIGDEATRAVVPVYRRIYAERGRLLAQPYPGVAQLLAGMVERGRRVALATSKVEPAARRILADQGWTELFDTIVGDTPDAGRPTKAQVIAEAMARLGADPADAVMVGDRRHDVVGARENGLACLGAGWGYGEPGELRRAGAARVYDSVGELEAVLAA